MSPRDLHNNILTSRALAPAAATTDNTAYVSTIADRANGDAIEFVGVAGSIADADVSFTVLVEDSDASDMTGAEAVADSQLIGTEAGAAPLFSNDNATFKVGYLGAKRYVRVTITPANNTGNLFLAGVWVQSASRVYPHDTQVN